MKNFRDKCPICENQKPQTLQHFSFIVPQGHPISEGYDLVVCEFCGFVYANISAKQEDYDEFYKKVSKYEDSKTSSGSGESDWEYKRFADTAFILSGYFSTRDVKVLDIGCANGGQLLALQKENFSNLYGIDPSDSCAIKCQNKGLSVTQGTIVNNSLPTNYFDCIIFSHVLEHIVDLSETINSISKLLKDDGLLYVEVPDANRYKDYLFSPYQDINTEHINHFSLKTIHTLFSNWELINASEKEILSSPNNPYPSIFCVLKKTKNHDEIIYKDDLLPKNMKIYLEKSARVLSSIDIVLNEKLAANLSGGTELIVWGTGQLTMKLLTETCLKKFNIVGFIDGNPINQGRVFANQKILSPHEIGRYSSSIPILISTILHKNEIIEVIKKLNISNPIITIA